VVIPVSGIQTFFRRPLDESFHEFDGNLCANQRLSKPPGSTSLKRALVAPPFRDNANTGNNLPKENCFPLESQEHLIHKTCMKHEAKWF